MHMNKASVKAPITEKRFRDELKLKDICCTYMTYKSNKKVKHFGSKYMKL